jgi:ribosomal protein L5
MDVIVCTTATTTTRKRKALLKHFNFPFAPKYDGKGTRTDG